MAEQLSDIEYTDAETGLEWLDMDCVDCCRVSNDNLRAKRRDKLLTYFLLLARQPEIIPDGEVDGLLNVLVEIHTKAIGTD